MRLFFLISGLIIFAGGCAVKRPQSTAASICDLKTRSLELPIGAGPRGNQSYNSGFLEKDATALASGPEALPEALLDDSLGELFDIAEKRAKERLGQVDIYKGVDDADDDSVGPLINRLVLSGGGQYGAFGAGFLHGLQAFREYDVVTGVSTGALQAPFAFLGKAKRPSDRELAQENDFPPAASDPNATFDNLDDLVFGYSITSEGTLYNSKGPLSAVRRGYLGTLEPLRRRIGHLVTDSTLRELAKAPAHRQLNMALLNWDTGEAVSVDMLDLARRHAGGDDTAHHCFIRVMVAASSEPIGTPPVLIDGSLFVDAGLRFGVFVDDEIKQAKALADGIRGMNAVAAIEGATVRTDVIRNGDLGVRTHRPEKYDILKIVGRARTILVDQVYRFSIQSVLHQADSEHTVRFAVFDPKEVGVKRNESLVFDPQYMAAMIEAGKRRAGKWDKEVP